MVTYFVKFLFLGLISAQTLKASSKREGETCFYNYECWYDLECCVDTNTCCYESSLYSRHSVNLTSVFIPLVLVIVFVILMIYCCVKKCNQSVQAPVTTTSIISTNPQRTTYSTGPQPPQQYYPAPNVPYPYQTGPPPPPGAYPPPPPGAYPPPAGVCVPPGAPPPPGAYPPPVGVPSDQPPPFNTLYNQPVIGSQVPPPIGLNPPLDPTSPFISGDPPPYNQGK